MLIVNHINLVKKEVLFKGRDLELNEILIKASNFCDIEITDLKSKKKNRKIADARCLYFAYAKENSRKSLQNIGDVVFRNHATVIYGINKTKFVLKNKYKNFLKYMQDDKI